jgi:hypothetical protein
VWPILGKVSAVSIPSWLGPLGVWLSGKSRIGRRLLNGEHSAPEGSAPFPASRGLCWGVDWSEEVLGDKLEEVKGAMLEALLN